MFSKLEQNCNNLALIDKARNINISYKDLVSYSNVYCEPIPSRNLVLVLCDNSPQCIAIYVGFIRKRIIPIMISSNTPIDTIIDYVDCYKPDYIYKSSKINLPIENYNNVSSYDNFDLLKYIGKYHRIINPDLALLLPTSGSTGAPKFVRLSYNNLYSNTSSISDYLNICSSDRAITSLPLYYSFGLSVINTHIFNGASIVITNDSFLDVRFWNTVEKLKVTTVSGVPFSFKMLRRMNIERYDLSSIRYITQAGGKLDAKEAMYWNNLLSKQNILFIIMYGQTEATARMSYLPIITDTEHAKSIGQAIPGGRFALYDREGCSITDLNVEGELVYFGENVSLGYATNIDDLALGDQNNKILHTGDIAYKGESGYYYITGRKKRFLKLFGIRVGLDQLENSLNALGVNCICGGKDDQLKVYLLNDTDSDSNTKLANDYISEKTLISPVSYEICLIDRFPVSDTGKILYSKLQ